MTDFHPNLGPSDAAGRLSKVSGPHCGHSIGAQYRLLMAYKATAALFLPLALSGCSSTYDVRALVLDGKVAFVPTDTDIWGDPDCIYSISVSAVDGPSAKPEEGDSIGMVEHGVYWNESFAVTSCDNPFPVVYGEELIGPPFRENYEYVVKAKPLRIGVVYEVTTASNGSAYGGGKFMITEQRRVVNLPR
jgi:hypothetical protein